MRKYNQLNDVVLSGNGGICPVEKDQTMSTIVWAKKSVHLHKWSFLYLEFWLEFSEVSTKFLRLGFLLRFVPFILQIDWSCWLQIKSHPIIWWLLNEVSGQLCTIIIRQKKKLCIPILGNRSWILGRLCSFACRLCRQASAALLPWLCELSGLLLRDICFLLLPKPSSAFAGPKISKWSLLTFSLDKTAKEESSEWPAGWGWGWKAQAEWRWVRRLAPCRENPQAEVRIGWQGLKILKKPLFNCACSWESNATAECVHESWEYHWLSWRKSAEHLQRNNSIVCHWFHHIPQL